MVYGAITLTKPISFADLVGATAVAETLPKRKRGRPPGRKVRAEEEAERAAGIADRQERAAVVAQREAHLPAVPEKSPAQTEHEAAAAQREHRIRENIKKSLAQRIEHNIAPMAAKQLALELAHFNMVHLSGHAVEVIERVAEYARDPQSPHHEWALRFMAERAMPQKVAQEAQLDAAGLSTNASAPRVPEVHIHVGAAVPVRQSDVIDAIPVRDEPQAV